MLIACYFYILLNKERYFFIRKIEKQQEIIQVQMDDGADNCIYNLSL